jgi:hypothetical protein
MPEPDTGAGGFARENDRQQAAGYRAVRLWDWVVPSSEPVNKSTLTAETAEIAEKSLMGGFKTVGRGFQPAKTATLKESPYAF